ncbi:MAG: VanZ family protein, partial [Gemmatimonadales bacterium]
MSRSRDSGLVLALAGLAFIAAETLVPRPGDRALVELTGLTCLICGSLGGVDVLLNVILFIPLGLGLGLLKTSGGRALAFVVATTITIEILQLGVIAGRDSSLSDLLTNTLGGMLGYWLARRWRRILFPSPALSARLAVSAAAVWVGVQAVTAWAVQPAPPPPVYYGQWAAELGHLHIFEGTLLDATINGAPMPAGAYRNSNTVRHAIKEGNISAEALVIPGRSTTGLAPIMSIFNDRQQEVLLLGRNLDDVIFRLRTHASDLRIRGPALRLPDGFSGLMDDT